MLEQTTIASGMWVSRWMDDLVHVAHRAPALVTQEFKEELQNSVFFHAIDELDTAHTAVVLTTNRIDLVDEAIIDRFLPYEFGVLTPHVLEEVAHQRATLQQLDKTHLTPVLSAIRDPLHPIKSIREVERMVTRAYVVSIIGSREK